MSAVPAVAAPKANGVALENTAFKVTLAFNAPPPDKPVPAITCLVSGTKPDTENDVVVAAVTRPLASTVRMGNAVELP